MILIKNVVYCHLWVTNIIFLFWTTSMKYHTLYWYQLHFDHWAFSLQSRAVPTQWSSCTLMACHCPPTSSVAQPRLSNMLCHTADTWRSSKSPSQDPQLGVIKTKTCHVTPAVKLTEQHLSTSVGQTSLVQTDENWWNQQESAFNM